MGSSRLFRRRLALTTILTVAPFFGYGRQASAACDPSPSPTFLCGGANIVTQAITADNANVSTVPGFSVNAPAGHGISITGDGHLQFVDGNASIITGDDNGLDMRVTGDAGATQGAITITGNSTITGGDNGIHARNDGGGDINITANGSVTGLAYDGINAGNTAIGGDVTIRTGAGSTVSGYTHGIKADNAGTGDLEITADGKVTGARVDGISASVGSSGRNLTITTGAESEVSGYGDGIDARSLGSGDLTITANGKVTGMEGQAHGIFASTSAAGENLTITTGAASEITGNFMGIRGVNGGSGDLTISAHGEVAGTEREGIYALNLPGSGDLTVTAAAGSVVTGGYDGIEARSLGHGALLVAAYGEVTGTVGRGIWVVNYSGASATVKTGAESNVTGYDGIAGRNDRGDFTITADGEVTGTERDGIYALNTPGAGALKITAGSGSNITGYRNGILARNNGDGDLDIIAHGNVTGETRYGIEAFNSSNGGDLTITTTAGSDITGKLHGIRGKNYGSGGDLVITADGEVTGEHGDGIVADNRSPAVSLTVTTGAASVITGDANGINANNSGSGDLTITANGSVEGTTRAGITAFNSNNGKNLKITTGAASAVTGGTHGIYATNSGQEDLEIVALGDVTGLDGYGIRAQNSANSANLTITTGAGSDVKGSTDAIEARNSGSGTLAITVDGAATGTTGNGIMAVNYAAGDALTIETGAGSAVKGFNGIAAQNSGRGALTITVDGDVTGTNFDGIYARNFDNDAQLTIITGAGSNVKAPLTASTPAWPMAPKIS
ncbi:hypothetical protein G5V57_06035 [Nordella sp. HKS 07]|uniref:beta strand repeat-containing protein n=1 Tax=Nordella sp. HKS 07 TaxID=2712222 RepID=UPI0013E1409F|nr:hypothetical protein [Nordella sp. HKS 07]QIG47332.1 hypothetical protein G5V57_06035 [Nordella sp. HKS 07]